MDKKKYHKISESKGLPITCPIFGYRSCWRCYVSMLLLKKNEGFVGFPDSESEELEKFWNSKIIDLPVEDHPSIDLADHKILGISNFCPEVTFRMFGWYVSHFYKYADKIDIEFAHKQLKEKNIPTSDIRYYYSEWKSKHFPECIEYQRKDEICRLDKDSTQKRIGFRQTDD